MRARRSSRSASGVSIVNGRMGAVSADPSVMTAMPVLLVGRLPRLSIARGACGEQPPDVASEAGHSSRPACVIWLRAGAALTCAKRSPIPHPARGCGYISTQAPLPAVRLALDSKATRVLRWPSVRYVGGVLLLAAAYYGAAKVGQTLRYTASVSAIWPPAGLGIAALYLWGLRWWPGVLLGELVVNGQLLLDDSSFPVGSLLGQQTGNMAEIIVGALLLRRLIGPNAAMDRVEHVGGMLVALGAATAISATAGTLSMIAGGVVDESDATEFWRTWWLGDTSGGLVVLPLLLAWARDPLAAWRRIRTWEGAAAIAAVIALGLVAL